MENANSYFGNQKHPAHRCLWESSRHDRATFFRDKRAKSLARTSNLSLTSVFYFSSSSHLIFLSNSYTIFFHQPRSTTGWDNLQVFHNDQVKTVFLRVWTQLTKTTPKPSPQVFICTERGASHSHFQKQSTGTTSRQLSARSQPK